MVDLAAQAFNEAIAAGNTADATKSTEMIVRLKNLIQSEEDKGKAKVVTDLTSMPEWQVLASKILHALTPYPEALKAVRKVVAYNDTTDTIVPEVTNNDQP